MTTKKFSIKDLEALAIGRLLTASDINTGQGSTGGRNGFYGWITADGKHQDFWHPCHAYMHSGTGARVVYSKYIRQSLVPEKESKAYLDWLLNYSPWSKFCKENIKYEGGGFINSNVDTTPANLQHNFLVASRMISEWGLSIRTWYWLVTEKKIDPNVAYFFLAATNDTKTGWPIRPESNSIHVTPTDKYDWPLDHASNSFSYFKNFCNGKWANLIQAYGKDPQYRPVNKIWQSSTEAQKFPAYLQENYPGEVKAERGLVAHGVTQVQRWTMDQLVDIMKKETEKVYA